MGYDSINAQGLTAPPYLGAFITSIAAAYISDRWGNRGYIMSFSAGVAAIGYALLATQSSTGARYLGIWMACCGVFPSLAINMTWMLNNNAGDTKKGVGMSMLAIIGQCSSFIASFVFPNEDAPYYLKGNVIGCALTGLIVPTGLILHFAYSAENKRKDRLYGKVDPNIAPVDVSQEGDKHRNFRLLT